MDVAVVALQGLIAGGMAVQAPGALQHGAHGLEGGESVGAGSIRGSFAGRWLLRVRASEEREEGGGRSGAWKDHRVTQGAAAASGGAASSTHRPRSRPPRR